jgi:hypothetical protein
MTKLSFVLLKNVKKVSYVEVKKNNTIRKKMLTQYDVAFKEESINMLQNVFIEMATG